jgi:hypothetical protein
MTSIKIAKPRTLDGRSPGPQKKMFGVNWYTLRTWGTIKSYVEDEVVKLRRRKGAPSGYKWDAKMVTLHDVPLRYPGMGTLILDVYLIYSAIVKK